MDDKRRVLGDDWPYNEDPVRNPQGTNGSAGHERGVVEKVGKCDNLQPHSAKTVQVKGDHYKKYPIQPYEYNQRNGLRYCEGNVVKYVTRHRDKGGKDDILKAIHYLQLLLEEEYK
jgi:hypothetical protein